MKPPSKDYQEGWDRIFGKKKEEPRMLSKEEVIRLREDLIRTVEVAKRTKVEKKPKR